MCFGAEFLLWLALRILAIILLVGLVNIWLPYLVGGWSAPLTATVRLIIWFIVATLVVIVLFSLFECLVGWSGGGLLYHRGALQMPYHAAMLLGTFR